MNNHAFSALVTGASRGIGRGIAVELAKAGGRVAINYAGNEAAANEALALVRAAGGDGFIVQGLSKEARERGEKGPIIGNWKYHQQKARPGSAAAKPAPAAEDPDGDLPF